MSERIPQDLPERLAAMADISDIKAVVHRLARGLDRCDKALIRSCFHDDGSDDHGFFRGTAGEFCDWVVVELSKFSSSQHMICTLNVELTGTSAVCESYFLARLQLTDREGDREISNAGRYIDTVEQRNGVWKIRHRHCVYDWTRNDEAKPVAESPASRGRMWGGRFPEDDSYRFFRSDEA